MERDAQQIAAAIDFQRPKESGGQTISTPTEAQIAQLWARMASMYGHRWLSAYGERDEDGTWRRVLSGLVGEQIAKGLRGCIESGSEWPPSAPEFRRMCLGLRVDTSDGGSIANSMPPHRAMLESDEVKARRKELGRKAFAEMREKGLIR